MNPNKLPIPSLQELYYVTYPIITRRELYEKQYKVIKIISGMAELSGNNKTVNVRRGEYLFVNQGGFSRITMIPEKNAPFKLICLNFSDKFIQKYKEHHLTPAVIENSFIPFHVMRGSVLFEALFSSLQVYAQKEFTPDQQILNLKLEESLHILELEYYSIFCRMMSNYKITKINLKEFMEHNFIYNAPLERFAKLSGRSLSTFRREFIELFDETPNKWLIRKRLERGYEMIAREGARPIDIYWELGFETLAHFSRRFKEQYGINPSELRKGKP
ncbi:MAG: AraC family transcriptional regulator [Bacteroidales bacterium]